MSATVRPKLRITHCSRAEMPGPGSQAGIRALGVMRLSLGVENFDDRILELNGRAHRSSEICRAWDFAGSLDFPQINLDLISGMLGESDETWTSSVEEAVRLGPPTCDLRLRD